MHSDRPVWMALYFSDFFNDSKVQEMNNVQLGMYLRLLHYGWNANPPGTVPLDVEAIRRILKYEPANKEFSDNIDLILECFKPVGNESGRLVQKRLLHEYKKALTLKTIRSKAGKRARAVQLKQKKLRTDAGVSTALDLSDSVSDSDSDSDSDKKDSKDARARARKKEHDFSKSPFAHWVDFRNALPDWAESRARYYYDQFQDYEITKPGKYRYADWIRAARNWDRMHPGQWKGDQRSQTSTKESRMIAAVQQLQEEADEANRRKRQS